ncbi:glycoside hydrolase family 27 protein [Pedobacter sp. UYEF25]
MKKTILKGCSLIILMGFAIAVETFAQTPEGAAPVSAVKNIQPNKSKNLASTPPMGWNTWNTFQTHIDEPLLKAMVDAYVSSGMRDAGYRYFVLDDGWMTRARDANGELVADPEKFPNGMKEFADYVHAKGLKFGIYNCAGNKTCAGYPGSRGHEYQDARLYASWGVDFLKYDWCNTDSLNAREAYITMSQALKATGRPIVFSLCEWGNHQPWLWAEGVGELYRTTGDITANFDKDKKINNWTALSVMTILDKQVAIAKYNGPNHWNDPDMLEVGNGMSLNEDRAHFSMWCMLSAPLTAGNDLRKMSEQTGSILTNKEAIAIDQDALGIAARRSSSTDSLEVWIKPLADGGLAVCFLNRSSEAKKIDYRWKEQPLKMEDSKTVADFNNAIFKLRDVWSKKNVGTTEKHFKQTVNSHDVVMLRLTKL